MTTSSNATDIETRDRGMIKTWTLPITITTKPKMSTNNKLTEKECLSVTANSSESRASTGTTG